MATLYPPPPRGEVRPVFTVISATTILSRIYDPTRYEASAIEFRRDGPHGRFDHHTRHDSNRGILYAAEDMKGCLVEIYGNNRSGYTCNRCYCEIPLLRDLRMLDLRGDGVMNAGTIAKVCSGSPRMAQQWSRHFYDTYSDIDGIVYPNGHNSDTALALYERAANALATPSLDTRLDDVAIRNTVVFAARQSTMAIAMYCI